MTSLFTTRWKCTVKSDFNEKKVFLVSIFFSIVGRAGQVLIMSLGGLSAFSLKARERLNRKSHDDSNLGTHYFQIFNFFELS